MRACLHDNAAAGTPKREKNLFLDTGVFACLFLLEAEKQRASQEMFHCVFLQGDRL